MPALSIERLKSLRDHILGLDLSAISWEDAEGLMTDFMQDLQYPTARHLAPLAYRVRANDDPKQQTYFEKSEVWAKPAHICNAGRFNQSGESVLYLSATPEAALLEMRPRKPKEKYTIVGVTMPGEEPLRVLSIGSERFVPNAGTGPAADEFTRGPFAAPNFLKGLQDAGLVDHWMIQNELIVDLVTRWMLPGISSDLYKLTVPIWKWGAQSRDDICGLRYPSVRHGLHGLNIALKPAASNPALQAVEAWEFRLDVPVDSDSPGEKDPIGTVIRRGDFGADDKITWHREGAWTLDEVADDLVKRIGPRTPPSGMHTILQYSRDEVKAGKHLKGPFS